MTRTAPPVLARVAFVSAGVLFLLYPALRPYSSEQGLDGAAAFASISWVASHVAGMVAFMLLTVGLMLRALHGGAAHRADEPGSGRAPVLAAVAAWIGTSLVLPYYGAETFGLHAVGAYAVSDGDGSLLELTDLVRYAPAAMVMFGAGLVALAVAGGALIRATWRTGGLTRSAGLTAGVALVLYLPQFFGTPGLRIAHGLVLAVGCVLLARATRPEASRDAEPHRHGYRAVS